MTFDDRDYFRATPHDAVLTLWFVSAAHPEKVIAASYKADRGFGRKYLAQLNPSWPITPIGQFSLNRSAQASSGEFYIVGLPGVSIVQTVIEDASELSLIDDKLRTSLPAADVYAFASNADTGLGGFAHWRGGKLRRSFSARRERVYEDVGLPEPFEAPYWAGEKAEPVGGIALPFEPIDLMEEAQRYWLGFDMATSQDINVVAYAIDGRPEPKLLDHPESKKDVSALAALATSKLGLGSKREYDDYEDVDEGEPTGEELTRFAEATGAAARRFGKGITRRLRSAVDAVKYRIRHADRQAPPAEGREDTGQLPGEYLLDDGETDEKPEKNDANRDLYDD